MVNLTAAQEINEFYDTASWHNKVVRVLEYHGLSSDEFLMLGDIETHDAQDDLIESTRGYELSDLDDLSGPDDEEARGLGWS